MKTHNRIPSLDGLRAISILLVLRSHSSPTIPEQWRRISDIVPFGHNSETGVLTFFIISGYLITYLLRKEWEKKGTIDLKGFYLRRIFRIFPAFYSYAFVILILTLTGLISLAPTKLLSAFTFTWNYNEAWDRVLSSKDVWFIGHFWTLSLEEQFYLLWPLTILTFGLVKSRKVALAIIVCEPFIRIISYFAFPYLRGQLGMMLHTASDPIMLGCTIALLEGNEKFEALVKRLSNGFIPSAAFVFVFVLSPILTQRFKGAYDITLGFTLESLALAAIIIWVIRQHQSGIGRFLNSPILVYIGTLSYSLYLWQQLFLTPLNRTWLGIYPINLVVSFIVAMISYHLIEKPFLVLKTRLSNRKQEQSLAAS